MHNFWKNKNILITGASGFVGSHLKKRLLNYGSKVNEIVGNIADKELVNRTFKSKKFNFCFHLAAQTLLDKAGIDPASTFEINIKGTWNILEATRQNRLDGIIIASTTHVYGKNKLPFLEEYYPRPAGPYETSKACADMIAQTYANYYSLPVAIARFVNIFGPGDQNDRIVPKTIKLLMQNKAPEIYSDETTRDYMYVEDAVSAYLTLAEKLRDLKIKDSNIIFNFGTGKHYSNLKIIEQIIKLYSSVKHIPVIIKKERKLEVVNQYVSIEKAKKYLKWKPEFDLNQGLRKTIDWYKSYS